MQTFNIIKKSEVSNNFRNEQIRGMFDFRQSMIEENFSGEIPDLDDDWTIGLIVGNSGTGKSTIAKQIFGDNLFSGFNDWGEDSFINAFPEMETKKITEILTKVGLSSVPSWLKPFNVLSNGEKMRAEIARLICERDLIVYDEFTSVVDRNIGQIASSVISKFIRKSQNKRFVGISCHYDIIDWMCPDWIFDCNKMKLEITSQKKNRPEINLEIRRGKYDEWKLFSKYHYLEFAHKAMKQNMYVAEINGKPCAWLSIRPFPSKRCIWKVHRLVVLPDYQGLGIGIKFLEWAGDNLGKILTITTSNPALCNALFYRKQCWRTTNNTTNSRNRKNTNGKFNKALRNNNIIMSFEYKKKQM